MVEFRDKLVKSGMLLADYPTHEGFDDIIRPHLLLVLGQMLNKTNIKVHSDSFQAPLFQDVSDDIKHQLMKLALEYDSLRANMPASSERTGLMSVLATKMRSLSISARSLLPELVTSESAGARLAAVSILQSMPDVSYLDWMAKRIQIEKPFIRYQIATAFVMAVRILDPSNYKILYDKVTEAEENIKKSEHDYTDQMSQLLQAKAELALLKQARLFDDPV